jgi:hypothetical protein
MVNSYADDFVHQGAAGIPISSAFQHLLTHVRLKIRCFLPGTDFLPSDAPNHGKIFDCGGLAELHNESQSLFL